MNCAQTAIKSRYLAIVFLLLAMTKTAATNAVPITIEPDNYADGQVLNTISPFVTLSTAVLPSNNPTFDVVAYTDTPGASTGSKVFAHGGGVTFWADIRKLRMDFLVPVTSISLDYIARGFFDNSYAGRLEAYSAAGTLLTSDDTALLFGGQHEMMTVTAPNIAYALAYPPLDPFGDLDHLQFTAVPEPGSLLMLVATAPAAFTFRRRRKSCQSY
jgi:hypothetical protein